MIIYIATQTETKILKSENIEPTKSIVYINEKIFDETLLAIGLNNIPNIREIEIFLNEGDVVSALDNDLITYTIS